jgi:hypothetical protein
MLEKFLCKDNWFTFAPQIKNKRRNVKFSSIYDH